MKINGKDIRFAYTVGVRCDFWDFCAEHGNKAFATASLYEVLFMNRAYAKTHEGADTITAEEIRDLPAYYYDLLIEEAKAVKERDSKQTVETKEKKQEVRNDNLKS